MKKQILQAGDILKKAFFEVQNYGEKEKGHLLSEYDLEIHRFISEAIKKKHPEDVILSEEGPPEETVSETYWVLDPIDGTTCFIFGEPYFAVSLAKVHKNRVTEAHVYNPISQEYYFSDTLLAKSFLNDKPIHVSSTDKIEESLCCFGYSIKMEAIQACYNDWNELFDNCRKGLAWVSPALSICNVARGRVDVFIDRGCGMFGQAAAALILQNAGGGMYNYDKSEYDFRKTGGIFTNGNFRSVFD